jgi:hypothetical protein
MNRAQWIELAAIAVIAAACWISRPLLPAALPVWEIVLGLSALLLVQSLVRDIAILLRNHRHKSILLVKEAQCFCLESTVGLTGVIAGVALIGLGNSDQIVAGRLVFFLAVSGTMMLGFLIRDLVIFWHPFGIRREKDHLNLVVRWRRKSK